jgi:hypothetical protein
MLAALLLAISYGKEIVPLLAMRCGACHGLRSMNPAADLGLRTYADVMRGGNLGRVVVPGDPEKSLLIHFIDGRRGAGQRMPAGAAPLAEKEIERIRRWIEEGARDDQAEAEARVMRLAGVKLDAKRQLHVRASAPVDCFVTVALVAGGRTLYVQEAVARAGQRLSWDVWPERDWPEAADIEMTMRYFDREPAGATLTWN